MFVDSENQKQDSDVRNAKIAQQLIEKLERCECYSEVIIFGTPLKGKTEYDLTFEKANKIEKFFAEFAKREKNIQIADED